MMELPVTAPSAGEEPTVRLKNLDKFPNLHPSSLPPLPDCLTLRFSGAAERQRGGAHCKRLLGERAQVLRRRVDTSEAIVEALLVRQHGMRHGCALEIIEQHHRCGSNIAERLPALKDN